MTYANFTEAYMDGDMQATRIGLAVEKAVEKLTDQGLAPVEFHQIRKMWQGMCNTAWAFHILEQQVEE